MPVVVCSFWAVVQIAGIFIGAFQSAPSIGLGVRVCDRTVRNPSYTPQRSIPAYNSKVLVVQ